MKPKTTFYKEGGWDEFDPDWYIGDYRLVSRIGSGVGLIHCETGPAVYAPNGVEEYWINGVQMTEIEFKFWSQVNG